MHRGVWKRGTVMTVSHLLQSSSTHRSTMSQQGEQSANIFRAGALGPTQATLSGSLSRRRTRIPQLHEYFLEGSLASFRAGLTNRSC